MKKIRILIITLIIILTLGCATFAILYFATDTFKSNKRMFNEYLSQINMEDIIKFNEYNIYLERLENERCSSEGNLSISMKAEGEVLVDETFDFTTQTDPLNDFSKAKIDIKQNDEEKLTIDYLKNGDLYGIKFNDIIKQYLVFENNNLKEFAKKLGIDEDEAETIPDKIDLKYNKATNEELRQIYSKYINTIVDIIIEEIPNENYSKIDKESITVGETNLEADGYQLSIDDNELKEVLLKLLDLIKEDEQLFNYINKLNNQEYEDFDEYKQSIEALINTISNSKEEKFTLNIIVYKQGKNTVKLYAYIETEETDNLIDFSIDKIQNIYNLSINANSDGSEINFSKNTNSEEQETYLINIKENEIEGSMTIKISRDGKLDSQSIRNSFEIEILSEEENTQISVAYNNTKNFGENVEIDKFKEGDYAIINEFSLEQIENLIENLTNLVYEKIDKDKSFFGMIQAMNDSLFYRATEASQATKQAMEQERALIETLEQTSEQAQEIFNSRFDIYEGIQRGSTVKALLNSIELNNSTNVENNIECDKSITDIDTSKDYSISFEKDSRGYINKVVIEEQ